MRIRSKAARVLMVLFFFVMIFCVLPENQVLAQKAGVLSFEGRLHSRYLDLAGNKLVGILLDLGRLDLVKPREMDRILQDFGIRYYRDLQAEEVKMIGERAAIDLLFAGFIENLEVYWDSNQRRYKAEGEITVRIYDPISGRVIRIINQRGSASHGNREDAQFQALENCFSSNFVRQLREEFLLTSTIKEIENDEIYFFGGRDLGVKIGSRYQILQKVAGTTQYKQIGLLEVISVENDFSRGKVLYAREPLQQDHLLEEMVSKSRFKLNLGYSNMPFKMDGSSGRLNIPGIRVGNEVPFSHSSKVLLEFAGGGGAFIFDIGGVHVREFPITPGSFYGTLGGSAGFSMGMVEGCGEVLGSAGIFGELLAGVKYYPRQEHGMTFSLEGVGRLATPLTRWQDINEGNVSPCGPNLRTSGLGIRISVGLGF